MMQLDYDVLSKLKKNFYDLNCLLALKIDSYVLFSKKNFGLQSPKLKKNLLIYQTKLKSYLAPPRGTSTSGWETLA